MDFLHAISSDCQTRLLNVLAQIAMVLGDKKKASPPKFLYTFSLITHMCLLPQPPHPP